MDPKFTPIPVEKIPIGRTYPFAIFTYLPQNDRFVAVLPKGDEHTNYHFSRWRSYQLNTVYIPSQFANFFDQELLTDWQQYLRKIPERSLRLTEPWDQHWKIILERYYGQSIPWSYGSMRRLSASIYCWDRSGGAWDNSIVQLALASCLCDIGLVTLPLVCHQFPTPLRQPLSDYEELLYESHPNRTEELVQSLYPDCPIEVQDLIITQHQWAAEDLLAQCFQAGVLLDETGKWSWLEAIPMVLGKEPAEGLSRLGSQVRGILVRTLNT